MFVVSLDENKNSVYRDRVAECPAIPLSCLTAVAPYQKAGSCVSWLGKKLSTRTNGKDVSFQPSHLRKRRSAGTDDLYQGEIADHVREHQILLRYCEGRAESGGRQL